MVEAATDATRVVNRKARTGVVVSDKGDQTIIVAVERAAPHRLYHKVIRRTRRYAVHDPENTASVGDIVRIEECRPISKTKRWRLVEVVQEREVAQVAAETIDATLVSEVQRSASRAAEDEQAEQPVAAAEPSGQGAEDAGGTPAESGAAVGAEPAAPAEGDTPSDAGAVGSETVAPEAEAAPIGDEVAGDETASDETATDETDSERPR